LRQLVGKALVELEREEGPGDGEGGHEERPTEGASGNMGGSPGRRCLFLPGRRCARSRSFNDFD
jgi:hypothetical protein